MKYQVGILDVDVSYSMALMEYINMRAKVPLQLNVFTEVDKLREFVRFQNLSLLLVGEENEHLDLPCKQLILTDIRPDKEQKNKVYRYQRAEKIVEIILNEITENIQAVKDKNLFVAFYSPIGRCGKTTLAKMFCEHFQSYIFVSWEGFSETSIHEDLGARFLYCMKSRKEDFDGMLDNMESQGKVVIEGPIDYRDVRQMDQEDIRWFRDTVSKWRDGICVVFDVGNTMLGDLNILKEFDCVYMPVLSDEISKKKLEHWDVLATTEWKTATMASVHRVDVTNQNLAVVAENLRKGGVLW